MAESRALVAPDEVDKYLFSERLRGIPEMRRHNLQLSDHPEAPGQPLLIAEIDELGIAIEHFCRMYLRINSSDGRRIKQLLPEVSKTLNVGGADANEIDKVRSHFVE
jgi:hypothetical protein